MWPCSQRFLDTLTRTHDLLAYADLLVDGDVAATTLGSADLQLKGGTVQVGEGVIRRTADLALTDVAEALVPVVDKGLIIPRLCEVRVYAGVRYWDATPAEVNAGTDVEYVPVFTGPILSYDLASYPAVGLSCSDRAHYVQAPFSVPYTVVAGQSIDDAIGSLLAAKVPPSKLDTNLPATNLTTTLLVYDEQADPADGLRALGTAAGWTVYVDPMGVFVAADEPELDPDAVVLSYVEGPGGALIRPKLSGSVAGIVNTWVVTGESPNQTSLTPWAKVTDDDPRSPTYVRGSYDEMTRFVNYPVLTTDAQCLLAAKTLRRREGGIADSLVAEVFPNPALEKGDVLEVTGGIVDRLIIADSFSIELTGAPMEISARAGYAEDAAGG